MGERDKEKMGVMKVRKLYLAALLTCMVFLLPTLSMPLAQAAEYVPFKATCSKGSAVATVPNPNEPILEISITGSGRATHMGAVTIQQHHYVNLIDMTFYGGTYTWTAANGDTIYGTYHGYNVPTSTGFEIHGVFTIDGGTGELINAEGGGLASGIEFLSGTFILILDGTISYE